MLTPQDHPPAWLFSFVDLAFLLLLALTQIGVEPGRVGIDLGEIRVPRVRTDGALALPAEPAERWQLRIHPPALGTPPFELAAPPHTAQAPAARLAADALREQLARLLAAGERKPLLAPHGDSRTEDLLEAASLLEATWPGRRRATIAPILARR